MKLTDREKTVLGYLCSGYTNKEIAEKMYLSVSTIKTHLESIYAKLGLTGRVEVALWAVLEAGIVPIKNKSEFE